MYKNVGWPRLAASGRRRLAVNGGRRFKWLRPLHRWPRHRLQGRMLSIAKLPRSQCIRLQFALVASAILLLCQCIRDPVSSDLEELTAMSEPVTFQQFICCNCHGAGDARIGTTFFATRRAVELHISRSRMCKTAGKGVSTTSVVYRESKRVEDQEAGPVGAPGQWPVRPAGAAGNISAPISCKSPRYRETPISVYCDIAYTSGTMSLKIHADVGIL